jgi:transcriptional regulator of arginine metabolism
MNIYASRKESFSSRPRRLTLLAQLLNERRFSSQQELANALGRSGAAVTQATLSRDLRSLGVVKRPNGNGKSVYELPAPGGETLDRGRQLLDLRSFVNEVRLAGNLAVVKTPPGHAHAVGRALDLLEFPGCVGSVAGDDTILVVLSSAAVARRLRNHLSRISAGAAAGPR